MLPVWPKSPEPWEAKLGTTPCNQQSLQSSWRELRFFWGALNKKDRPSTASLTNCTLHLPRSAAQVLFGDQPADIELLPTVVDGEPWALVNTLRRSKDFDIDLSVGVRTHLGAWEPPPRYFDGCDWLTIVDPQAHALDVFTISDWIGGPFFTESFVERFRALKLEGLDFKLVGQIVSDARDAAPPPPRESSPPPAAPTAAPRKPTSTLAPWEVDRVEPWQAEVRDLLETLDLDEDSGADEVLEALSTEWVEPAQQQLEAGHTRGVKGRVDKASRTYGALFVQHLGWRLADLKVRGRVKTWVVQSPDGKFALSPESLVSLAVEEPDASSLALTLNLVREGSLPPAGAGVTWLGRSPL